MKTRTLLATFAAAALLTVGSGLPAASAQEQKSAPDFTVGNKGEIHLNVKVKAGSVVLEPGMYQVQHALEGTNHFISFKAVQMPAGYRHGNTRVAREASARIECSVEPVEKKLTRTTITLRTNAAGEKEIAEVLIAGESFKHVL
jgi:hypothetical protein